MLLPVVKWNRSRQIQTSLPFLTSRSCYICYDDYTSRELLCPSPLKYRSIHSLGDNLAKNLSNNPMSQYLQAHTRKYKLTWEGKPSYSSSKVNTKKFDSHCFLLIEEETWYSYASWGIYFDCLLETVYQSTFLHRVDIVNFYGNVKQLSPHPTPYLHCTQQQSDTVKNF